MKTYHSLLFFVCRECFWFWGDVIEHEPASLSGALWEGACLFGGGGGARACHSRGGRVQTCCCCAHVRLLQESSSTCIHKTSDGGGRYDNSGKKQDRWVVSQEVNYIEPHDFCNADGVMNPIVIMDFTV